jgi:hypothetical protein
MSPYSFVGRGSAMDRSSIQGVLPNCITGFQDSQLQKFILIQNRSEGLIRETCRQTSKKVSNFLKEDKFSPKIKVLSSI